jgi:probable metal-binding protein
MQKIHGHEVMHMMVETNVGFTRESLKTAIHSKFGQDSRFYTCSAENMDADQLISFLESKGKFHPVEGGFTTEPSKICNH